MQQPGDDNTPKPVNVTSITVRPSDNVFKELGNNDYDFKDLLSELIDNSLAARVKGELVEISITLQQMSNDRSLNKLVIKDNASGIARSKLGDAISPAALQTNRSLNEHGLGMKQAIAGLGELESLTTKTADVELACNRWRRVRWRGLEGEVGFWICAGY
ncbi:MAG: hypothetical protein F4Y63_03685 [Chloroflexi bacterium]|nr:hypothetical protein [Chloroflexota bacterium]MYF79974.1 hypothetical protein [Chloroflexota bacterium]MYK61725.1 hypothetical protein [Chloroflexota bacterium]